MEAPDYGLEGHGHRIVGNGTVFLRSGERLIEAVGTVGETFFSADCGTEGSFRQYRETGALLSLWLYGLPPPEDPAWSRSLIKIDLYADPHTSTLVASVAAMHDLYLKLSFPEGIRVVPIERLSGEIGNLPCLKLMAPSGATMYLVASGRCRYSTETEVFHIESGYSRIVMVLCDQRTDFSTLKHVFRCAYSTLYPDDAPHNTLYRSAWVQKRARRRRLPKLADLPWGLPPLIERLRNYLDNGQAREGGLLLEEERPAVEAMCRTARFFVADRHVTAAKDFCGFLEGLYRRYGSIPYRCRPNGDEAVFYDGLPERAGEAAVQYLALCHKAFGWEVSEDSSALALQVLASDAKRIHRGMMPCFPFEEKTAAPIMGHFDGSAEATLRFVVSAKDALFLIGSRGSAAERHRLTVLADFVASSFEENFVSGDVLLRNQPGRALGLRKPHTLLGRCDVCGAVTALSIAPDRRGYLCDSCRGHGATFTAVPSELVPAPPELLCKACEQGLVSSLPGPEREALSDRIRLRYADPTDGETEWSAARLVDDLSRNFAGLTLSDLGETAADLMTCAALMCHCPRYVGKRK